MKKGTTGEHDTLAWKWQTGAATTTADLGDPLTGIGYQLCVYDETAGTATKVLGASAPAAGSCHGRPCWRGATGRFAYADRDLTPGGIAKLDLRAGGDGSARISVKGKGLNLALPGLPLVQDPEVVVQLVNALGVCWEARFPAPALANDGIRFKAVGD